MTDPDKVSEIHETLDRLHDELRAIDSLDENTRQELLTIADEIQTKVQTTEPVEQSHSFSDSLQETALKFEASYPVLTKLLQRISDGLASLGI